MTQTMAISATEHGVVRVFLAKSPADLARGAVLPLEDIANALGVVQLNTVDVQQIWTDDTPDGIASFLRDAYGANKDDIAAQTDAWNTIDQTRCLVVVIRSSAFLDRPVEIVHASDLLDLIATVREPDASVHFEPLPNPDPAPALQDAPTKKVPSDAAMSGRIATLALLVMALLVWLMIWIAG